MPDSCKGNSPFIKGRCASKIISRYMLLGANDTIHLQIKIIKKFI